MNLLKKKGVLIAIAIIVVIAIVVGIVLSRGNKKGGQNGPAKDEPTYKAVVFLTENNSAVAVLEDGRVIDADPIVGTGVASGTGVQVTISENSVATAVRTITNNSIGGVRTTKEKAPEAFVEFWLDYFLYNGTNAAISEYKINDVSIIDDKSEGRIDIKVNFDVKPCEGVVIYGEADESGTVKGIERSFSIYGTQGYWTSYERLYNIMAKDIRRSANSKSDVFAAGDNQRILYANKNYVFYVEKTATELDTVETIYAFNTADKKASKLVALPEGVTAIYGALASGKLYINTVTPNTDFDKLYCVDVATAKLSVANNSAMALTATNDTLYFVTEDTKLHSMKIGSGETKLICTSPVSLSITRASITNSIKDNCINVYIQKDITRGYSISLADGKINEIERFLAK